MPFEIEVIGSKEGKKHWMKYCAFFNKPFSEQVIKCKNTT